MFKELKMKIAARRIERKNARDAKKMATNPENTPKTFVGRIKYIFHKLIASIKSGLNRIWQWIRCIDLIGLVNLTLLVAIIVLFSMLIIDIVNCRNVSNVVNTKSVQEIEITNNKHPRIVVRPVVNKKIKNGNNITNNTLPINRNPITRKYTSAPISVGKTNPNQQRIYRSTIHMINGDVIVDRGNATLKNNDHITGHLYLQNMRKYTLPCNIIIDGDLYLRDVTMLQFCGDFIIRGNIYVSPRSSFGPIPRTARLGGQVIL
ncbi:MAG: hypothetical protein MJ187_04650 [Alphaproteobacteria bacterium]|nr:hypothetical protein [Alphaproteobacteria bacterium]